MTHPEEDEDVYIPLPYVHPPDLLPDLLKSNDVQMIEQSEQLAEPQNAVFPLFPM
jgi:hypothetical protein